MADHTTAMYSFSEAFFAQLKASGVSDVVVSPGARSTPLVLAADKVGLETWVQIDERSAGFFALGMAKALRRPVALICTSGTAAANYLPAVIEASRSGVPLLVLTADRPPEVRGWGPNQTIDQVHIYGTAPRWFAELPVASESTPDVARRYAARAAATSMSAPRGPVHLNFPFRPPLAPDPAFDASGVAHDDPVNVHAGTELAQGVVAEFRELVLAGERGVFLAGAVKPGDIDVTSTLAVAGAAGWPVFAEPTSQLRVAAPESGATIVSSASYLVQHEAFRRSHRPDVVVMFGASPPHRSLHRWLGGLRGCRVVAVGDGAEWQEESFLHTDVFRADPSALFTEAAKTIGGIDGREGWISDWQAADAAAMAAIGSTLIDSDLFEGRVVTALAGVVPDDVSLYVGNSMAVRDVNLYWPRRAGSLDIYSNRGASGIDGLPSSALGVAAATSRPVVLLLGDLSLLHDLSGLLSAVRLRVPLVVVVTNNDGGGLFSFLPIAGSGGEGRFHALFHTPHGADLGAVVAGIGASHRLVESSTALQSAVLAALEADGPTVIEVQIDATASVKAHRRVDAAVSDAVSQLW